MASNWNNLLLKTVFVLLVFSSCSNQAKVEDNSAQEDLPHSEMVTAVNTYQLKKVSFNYYIILNGVIKAPLDQLLYSDKSQRVKKCYVKNGDRIRIYNKIAAFDNIEVYYRLQRDSLKEYNAQKEYESQLLGYGSLLKNSSAHEAESIKKKLRIAVGLSEVEQDITEAKKEFKQGVFRSPFSGIISDVNFQTGELVKSGQSLCRIYDPVSLYLDADILESDLSSMSIGTQASISPLANSETYVASVSEINPYVSGDGIIKIKLKVKNYGRIDPANNSYKLLPGMHCSGSITVRSPNILAVPKTAIVMKSAKAVVFTIVNGHAVWNEVVTGRDNGNEVEIIKGLKVGDKVITSNNLQLAQDALIQDDTGK